MTTPPVPIVAALIKPYFESHSIGRVWLAVAVTAGVIELVGVGRRRAEATNKDGGSQIVIRLCVIPAVILLVLSPRMAPAAEIRPPLVSVVVGIVVFSAGEALRVWSKVALGRYFTYGHDQQRPAGDHERPLPIPAAPLVLRDAADLDRSRRRVGELARAGCADVDDTGRVDLSHLRRGEGLARGTG